MRLNYRTDIDGPPVSSKNVTDYYTYVLESITCASKISPSLGIF